MALQVQVLGVEELQSNLQQYGAQMESEIVSAVRLTSQIVRSNAVRSIQKKSSGGRTYQKYNPRRTHEASPPGMPPNTDTGRLAGSIRVASYGTMADVGTDLDYGKFLELGTQEMAARPYMVPALEQARPGWNKRLAEMSSRAASKVDVKTPSMWGRIAGWFKRS